MSNEEQAERPKGIGELIGKAPEVSSSDHEWSPWPKWMRYVVLLAVLLILSGGALYFGKPAEEPSPVLTQVTPGTSQTGGRVTTQQKIIGSWNCDNKAKWSIAYFEDGKFLAVSYNAPMDEFIHRTGPYVVEGQMLRQVEGIVGIFNRAGKMTFPWVDSKPGPDFTRSNYRDRLFAISQIDDRRMVLDQHAVSSGPGEFIEKKERRFATCTKVGNFDAMRAVLEKVPSALYGRVPIGRSPVTPTIKDGSSAGDQQVLGEAERDERVKLITAIAQLYQRIDLAEVSDTLPCNGPHTAKNGRAYLEGAHHFESVGRYTDALGYAENGLKFMKMMCDGPQFARRP